MVFESTWRVQAVLGFILTRNYNGFLVDMDYLVQVNLHSRPIALAIRVLVDFKRAYR